MQTPTPPQPTMQHTASPLLQRLDAAVTAHMAHPAGVPFEPIADSMFDTLQAPAEEGAQAPIDYRAVADANEEFGWLPWAAAATVVLAVVASALYPYGFAA